MNAQFKPRNSLRPMQMGDLKQVLPLEQANYPFPWSEGIFRDCLLAKYPTRVLLDERGHLLGYAVLTIAVGEAHLLNLCIDARCQRQGLGGLLLQEICALARSGGADTLFLEVRPSNVAAKALYDRHGFEQIGRRRGYYPAATGREDALVLAKRL